MNPTATASHLRDAFGSAVYPVHPLVAATYALVAFETFEAALEPTEHGYSALVASSRVPGSGDAAYAADRVLRRIRDGDEVDEVLAFADDYWRRATRNGYADRTGDGLEQAHAMEALFRELAMEAWRAHWD